MSIYISVNNLTKTFEQSIPDIAISLAKLLIYKREPDKNVNSKRVINAVDNVSFEIKEGERVGIIGRNGAGKTTLLQMVSGLATPTSGTIDISGHVNCIMTLGIGLREDLTGLENIYIDGELSGKTRNEVDSVIDEIVAFADIGDFIDRHVRTYSTGMKSRLAFAMIIFIEPEILIIDEALSAGDAQFSIKASAKMKEICDKGKILIVVAHSMPTIVAMCNRCIWMDKGKIVMDGEPELVARSYVSAVRKEEESEINNKLSKQTTSKHIVPGVEITYLEFVDKNGTLRTIFDVEEEMTVNFGVRCGKRVDKPDFRISVERNDGILLLENYASEDGFEPGPIEGEVDFEIPIGPIFFGKSFYEVNLQIFDRDRPEGEQLLVFRKKVLKIEIPNYHYDNPLFFHPVEWSIGEMESTK